MGFSKIFRSGNCSSKSGCWSYYLPVAFLGHEIEKTTYFQVICAACWKRAQTTLKSLSATMEAVKQGRELIALQYLRSRTSKWDHSVTEPPLKKQLNMETSVFKETVQVRKIYFKIYCRGKFLWSSFLLYILFLWLH